MTRIKAVLQCALLLALPQTHSIHSGASRELRELEYASQNEPWECGHVEVDGAKHYSTHRSLKTGEEGECTSVFFQREGGVLLCGD